VGNEMKTWNVKTEQGYIQITAYLVTIDLLAQKANVVWADGIRIAFEVPVLYVEEL
jgi:hypothetical protein